MSGGGAINVNSLNWCSRMLDILPTLLVQSVGDNLREREI